MLGFHSGLLEAGLDGVFQGVAVTLGTTKDVRTALHEVDELLHEMISPDDHEIPLANIAGWPDVDVENLEREERWGL